VAEGLSDHLTISAPNYKVKKWQ